MRAYELIYIVNATLDGDALEAVQNRVKSVITEQGGLIDQIDVWGKRRLAYEIDSHREGFYVLVYFHANSTAEIERLLGLNESIIRFMLVRQAETDAEVATEAPGTGEPVTEEPAAHEAEAPATQL